MAFINIARKSSAPSLKKGGEAPASVSMTELAIAPAAAERLRALLVNQEPGSVLRVGVQGGGCSGLKPYFAFETQTREQDKVFEHEGVSICVDPKSLQVIGGSLLDYDQGFKLKSQQLKKSCSCGESFALV